MKGNSIALLIILLIVILFSGCSQASQKPAEVLQVPELDDTEWELVSLYSSDLIEGTAISLYFTDEYLGGQMGCNGYGGTPDSGKYHAKSDGTFTLGSLFAVTVQLCNEPEGIMEQEKTYIEALITAEYYQIVDDHLEIENKAGKFIYISKGK